MDEKQKKGGTTSNQKRARDTTLREENVGKKRVNVNAMLRMEHMQKLATWASVEAGIPPLGALFGHQLAATAQAEGVPLDPSTFACHRCESILRPGFNCTIRIEKIAKKAKPRKKSRVSPQNNVVYKCNFCSHPNVIRGTHRGYLKGLLASRRKLETDPHVQCSSITVMNKSESASEDNEKLSRSVGEETSLDESPPTLLEKLMNSSKKRKRRNRAAANKGLTNSVSSCVTSESAGDMQGGSSKRKRKGWSSLKEIAESNEARRSQSVGNFAIPFILPLGK